MRQLFRVGLSEQAVGNGGSVAGDGGSVADDGGSVAGDGGGASWLRAHEELLKLARLRAGLDFEEGHWLLVASRGGAHVGLGYGSFVEYAERLFGYGPRVTLEKLRVAEALEELSETKAELRSGKLSFSGVRELTRVMTPLTEREWLAAVRGKTVREIERMVSGHRRGSSPGDLPDPAAQRHALRFDVSAETSALFRDALAKVRKDAGEPIDDDAALLMLARIALGGPQQEGRANYQVAVTVCEHCRRGQLLGKGEVFEVAPAIVEMAACDCQRIGTNPRQSRERATQDVPPSIRVAVRRRDGGRCVVPGCRHAVFVDVHHIDLQMPTALRTVRYPRRSSQTPRQKFGKPWCGWDIANRKRSAPLRVCPANWPRIASACCGLRCERWRVRTSRFEPVSPDRRTARGLPTAPGRASSGSFRRIPSSASDAC